jgi:subtilisin-like proprotein convertase family protein
MAKFVKNKTYYLQGERWKLKFKDSENTSLGVIHHFKVTEHDDTEEDWDEYCTGDGAEILSTRKAWDLSIKDVENKCALNQVEVSTGGQDGLSVMCNTT